MEIQQLDEKYNNFQTDFVNVTTESNEVKAMIDNAKMILGECKDRDQQVKQELYMKRYSMKALVDDVMEAFHEAKCEKTVFLDSLQSIFS